MVTSCGSGVTAAMLWFALDAIGKEPKALYDGSWTEWASRGDLPIETRANNRPDVSDRVRPTSEYLAMREL